MNMQEEWDRHLLSMWKRNKPMIAAIKAFSILNNPNHFTNEDFMAWFFSLGLKRVPLIKGKGQYAQTIQQFIGSHSLRLNGYMYSGIDIEEIILVIDSIPWSNNIYYKPRSTIIERRIRMRELDKKHDWNIVK